MTCARALLVVSMPISEPHVPLRTQRNSTWVHVLGPVQSTLKNVYLVRVPTTWGKLCSRKTRRINGGVRLEVCIQYDKVKHTHQTNTTR
jgi:hypothetical protein